MRTWQTLDKSNIFKRWHSAFDLLGLCSCTVQIVACLTMGKKAIGGQKGHMTGMGVILEKQRAEEQFDQGHGVHLHWHALLTTHCRLLFEILLISHICSDSLTDLQMCANKWWLNHQKDLLTEACNGRCSDQGNWMRRNWILLKSNIAKSTCSSCRNHKPFCSWTCRWVDCRPCWTWQRMKEWWRVWEKPGFFYQRPLPWRQQRKVSSRPGSRRSLKRTWWRPFSRIVGSWLSELSAGPGWSAAEKKIVKMTAFLTTIVYQCCYTVEPRLLNASLFEQFGWGPNFSTKNGPGYHTITHLSNKRQYHVSSK